MLPGEQSHPLTSFILLSNRRFRQEDAMALIAHVDYALTSPTAPMAWLRRLYSAFISTRQNQADRRVAVHLRALSDETLATLGVPKSEIERFRKLHG